MNHLCIFLLSIVISSMSFAANIDLSKQDFFGEWQVIQINDRNAIADKEVWEFSKNTIEIIVDGSSDTTTTYEVLGNTIFVDSDRIKILEFSDNNTKLDGLGAVYHLKKLNSK